MDLSAVPSAVFLLLFAVYSAQLAVIAIRLRAPQASGVEMMPILELWPYLLIALLAPTLISLVPDLLGAVIEFLLRRTSNSPPAEPSFSSAPFMFVGVRLMIAYMATIITLELALQAQSMHSNKSYTWKALLLGNLALDIISLIALQFFKPIYELMPSSLLSIVFFLAALPTILTGLFVVSGAASELV